MSTVKNDSLSLQKTMATEVATASNEMAATPDTGVSQNIKRFCLFELFEYFDEYPSKEVRMFEGTDEADITNKCKEWAHYMTLNYSGGTTKFIKILSASEARKDVKQNIQLEKLNHPGDMEYIERSIRMYNESYPNDPYKFNI